MMTFYTIFSLATIAYMCFCAVKCKQPLYRTVAIVFVFCGLLDFIHSMFFISEVFAGLVPYLMKLRSVAALIFAIQLIITANKLQGQGKEGIGYNYALATALMVDVAFSVPGALSYMDYQWFHEYRVRMWPDFALIAIFAAMKINKVSLKFEEDLLLWYFSVASVVWMGFYFI
ncbi:MAG: hypothetical protein K0S32_2112 [Bacteroidetes bacterium]|jgi:hypothetical protein|nr:hypothetical protein [Bacteroidota bacterium]